MFTIAPESRSNLGRRRNTVDRSTSGLPDARPIHEELEHLADELPPNERAAVILRYAYDLTYAEIATALGTTEDAARQAASTGVRRLRKKELTP